MQTQYATCPACKSQNFNTGRCTNCGTSLPISPMPMQPYGGYGEKPAGAEKKIAAGICGILLGAFGVHKFIIGYTTEGVIMLLSSIVGAILLCGIPTMVMGVIGIIEGIMYLTKSDEEFAQTYVRGKKAWF